MKPAHVVTSDDDGDGDEVQVDQDAGAGLARLLSPQALDALIAGAQATGTPLDGPDGLLGQMTKAVIERALQAEMTHHLGYEHGDTDGAGSGNSRNGSYDKTVRTTSRPARIVVPRARNGEFGP